MKPKFKFEVGELVKLRVNGMPVQVIARHFIENENHQYRIGYEISEDKYAGLSHKNIIECEIEKLKKKKEKKRGNEKPV